MLHRTLLCVLALVLSLAYLPNAEARDAECTETSRTLFSNPKVVNCQPVTIDMTQVPIKVPHTMHVPNDAQLTLRVRHAVTDKCSIGFQAASITTPDPMAAVLAVLTGMKVTAPASVLAFDGGFSSDCLDSYKSNLTPQDFEAQRFNERVVNIRTALKKASTDVTALTQDLDYAPDDSLLKEVKNFITCTPKSDCSAATFDSKKAELQQRLKAAIQSLDQELNNLGSSLNALSTQLAALRARLGPIPADAQWFDSVDQFLGCAGGNLRATQKSADQLTAKLSALEAQLAKLVRIVEDSYALPLYHSEKITGNLVCLDQDAPPASGNPTADPKTATASRPPIPLEIDYQSPPNLAGSAGIVVSLLGQHTVGIKTNNVPNGTSAFTTYFAVTNQSSAQYIPFALLHLFLYGSTASNVSLAGGIGINPYNNSTQVEYFVGPSFTTHNVYLSVGTHIGRYQNLGGGFTLGSPVPTGWTTNTPVPTTLSYTAHLGIGITYKFH
jgi:hypothetical protein